MSFSFTFNFTKYLRYHSALFPFPLKCFSLQTHGAFRTLRNRNGQRQALNSIQTQNISGLHDTNMRLISSKHTTGNHNSTSHINRLKSTGHVMHQQFNIQQLYVLPTLCLSVLYLSENKQRLVPLTA